MGSGGAVGSPPAVTPIPAQCWHSPSQGSGFGMTLSARGSRGHPGVTSMSLGNGIRSTSPGDKRRGQEPPQNEYSKEKENPLKRLRFHPHYSPLNQRRGREEAGDNPALGGTQTEPPAQGTPVTTRPLQHLPPFRASVSPRATPARPICPCFPTRREMRVGFSGGEAALLHFGAEICAPKPPELRGRGATRTPKPLEAELPPAPPRLLWCRTPIGVIQGGRKAATGRAAKWLGRPILGKKWAK